MASLFFGVVIIAGLILLNRYFPFMPWTTREWQSLPTESEYRQLHPSAVKNDISHCVYCDSVQQFDFPAFNLGVVHRKVLCAKCKKPLWLVTLE
jgi:hypothetical protein